LIERYHRRDQQKRSRGHRECSRVTATSRPHQPRCEDELPREPTACHRYALAGLDELRLRDRLSAPAATAQRSTSKTSRPDAAGGAVHYRLVDRHRDVRPQRRRALAVASRRRTARSSSGTASRPMCASRGSDAG
jgi:hypothetical protein